MTLALDRKPKGHQRKALIKEMIYNKSLADELSEEAKKFLGMPLTVEFLINISALCSKRHTLID